MLVWVCLLIGLVLLSAFAVIASTHTTRDLYAQLQDVEAERWHLEEEYSRLLLEQSTWASHLLHFDGGEWANEKAPAEGHVRHMLAANDGGLWAVVELPQPGKAEDDQERGKGEQQLWHRSAAGRWTKVALPEGLAPNAAGGLDIAIDDTDQLWVALNANGRHALFTSDASGREIA